MKKRISYKTETYAHGDYLIDIVDRPGMFDAWLYKKNYGVKTYMFGAFKKYYNEMQHKEHIETLETFIEMVDANLPDYIKLYKIEIDDIERAAENRLEQEAK